MELHSLNRKRLCDSLQKVSNFKNGVIVLQGGESCTRYCSDVEPVFRQVSLLLCIHLQEKIFCYYCDYIIICN